MAFIQRQLVKSVEQTRGIFDKYIYRSDTDTIADVSSAGYFGLARFANEPDWDGSIIECSVSDGYAALMVIDGGTDVLYSSVSDQIDNRIIVREAADLAGPLDSTKQYFIDGVVDMGTQSIEVPAGGLYLYGMGFDISVLISTEDNYTLFTSPVGGSGNLVYSEFTITTSGTNSQVYDLNPVDPFRAIEIRAVNYDNCSSLGEITDYRQLLETGTGRFGGSPELTFSGMWNGARLSTTIVRSIEDGANIFKAGPGLSFSGRFLTDVNCDLNTTGALIDFADTNFANEEDLQLNSCIITRNGVQNADDTTIYPNINHTNLKSKWKNNVGLPNTNKYISSRITTEIATPVPLQNTYYPLLGTFTVDTVVQFDMPANGEFRLLTGNGAYQISGDLTIEGNSNDVIGVRITKSSDGGSTWPTVINHVRRQINSLVGGRDVGFFPINFISDIKKSERIRLEVENATAARGVIAELDSYLIVTEV